MRSLQLGLLLGIFTGNIVHLSALSQDRAATCVKAFSYKSDDYDITKTIMICKNSDQIPIGYQAEVNMPVCDDTLCANVSLIFYWDLAGNYKDFDTIPGIPLTKFDHKKFRPTDYLKLDQILKNKNSMLRILKKEDLVDKTIKVKATTIDAVSGATPKTIKDAVVEGAVYSSYTLWHFVNGAVKDSMAAHTLSIYSFPIAKQMLISDNYETQLFGLRKWTKSEYEHHSNLIFQVIRQSVPLIKAYAINKLPLPFGSMEKNQQFIALFPMLDDYSKSIFLNRITAEKNLATFYLPLMISKLTDFNMKQLEQVAIAYEKYQIPGYQELKKHINQTIKSQDE